MATRTAKNTKARGPKAGSSQRNQSVKGVKSAPAKNADLITAVTPARTGNGIVVVTATNESFVMAPWQDTGATRKQAVIGGSLAALKEAVSKVVKPHAKLANGVDSRNAPHAAKAVADAKAGTPAEKPAKGAAKAPKAKAEKNKQPSRGAERSYTVVKGTENKARPDSWRHHMTMMIIGATDTATAKANHVKSKKFPGNKLDFNWAAANAFIKFAK